jgi:hypothetical protein
LEDAIGNVFVVGNSLASDQFFSYKYAEIISSGKLQFEYLFPPLAMEREGNIKLSCFHAMLKGNFSDLKCDSINFGSNKPSPFDFLSSSEFVVIGGRYVKGDFELLSDIINILLRLNKKVFITGVAPEFMSNNPKHHPYKNFYLTNSRRPNNSELAQLESNTYSEYLKNTQLMQVNEELRNLAHSQGVGFIDRFDLQCDRLSQSCPLVDSDGKLLVFDYGHLTVAGQRYFAQRFLDDFVLKANMK